MISIGLSTHNSGTRQDQNQRHRGGVDNNGSSTSKRSWGGAKGKQKKATDYWYSGRKGHKESECWKKKADFDKVESCKHKEMSSIHALPKAQTKLEWVLYGSKHATVYQKSIVFGQEKHEYF